jgi:hypothetical protein
MWLGDETILESSLEGWIALLSLGQRVVGTGSSDSHHMVNQWVGYPRTYAIVPDDDPQHFQVDDVAAALREGHAFVTTGPLVELEVAGRGPGDAVSAEGGVVDVVVSIQAAPWVDVRRLRLWTGRSPLEAVPIEPPQAGESLQFEHRARLPFVADGFVLATVEGDAAPREVLPQFAVGPRAFTNPVWVDGDGDGVVTIRRKVVARVRAPGPVAP